MTTLTVPELRRLLEKVAQAEKAWIDAFAAAGPPRDADFGGEMSDADDRAFKDFWIARSRVSEALLNAAPALLDAIEAATKLIDDVQVLLTEPPEPTNEAVNQWMARSNAFLATVGEGYSS